MKINEVFPMQFPKDWGKGAKNYEIFGISQGRARELKNVLEKIYGDRFETTRKLLKDLPGMPTKGDLERIKTALASIVNWTAPRYYLEIVAELEVRNANEAAYALYVWTYSSFKRMESAQNAAFEVNNLLKAAENGKESRIRS